MLKDIIALELDFERALHASTLLSAFRQKPAAWELLLHLAQHDHDEPQDLHATLHQMQTHRLAQEDLLAFIQERRAEGLLRVEPRPGSRNWVITLAPALRESLAGLLDQRRAEFQRLLETSNVSTRPKPDER